MILLGYRGGGFIPASGGSVRIDGGKVEFAGSCCIAEGFGISVEGGQLSFGENVYANRCMMIECKKQIRLGKDTLLGWNVSIRDTDGHRIRENGKVKPSEGCILIGDHVWLGADVTVLKNSRISSGSVIACNSVVCGLQMDSPNELAGGIPARIIKRNVEWIE